MSLLRRLFYGRCLRHPDRWSVVSRMKQSLNGECAHCYGARVLAWHRLVKSGEIIQAGRLLWDGVTFPLGVDVEIPEEARRESEESEREDRDFWPRMDRHLAEMRARLDADAREARIQAEIQRGMLL